MSLESMESEIAGLRAKAADLADDYARTQAEVAADPNLTDSGKADALAPFHEQLKTRVAALHQQEKAVVKNKREALERSLYGTTGYASDISGFREAQLIAVRLNDADEAHAMYVNALRSDDNMLARAIFQQAGTKGWDKVTREHLTRNPTVKTTLADLEAIRRHEQSGGFGAAVNYMTPSLSTARSGMPPFLETRQYR
jgi:hypothetical protein